MSIDCVYFNDTIRCYRSGVVERYWHWLKKPFWRVVENTDTDKKGYNRVNVDKKMVYRHRLIAFCFIGDFDIDNPDEKVDHIDGNGLNNAVDNLRTCSQEGNTQNRVNTKGYTYDKRRGKYRSQIQINGRNIHGKRRETEEQARQDYLDLKEKYHTYFSDKEALNS